VNSVMPTPVRKHLSTKFYDQLVELDLLYQGRARQWLADANQVLEID